MGRDSYDWAAEAARLLGEIRSVDTLEGLVTAVLYRAAGDWVLGDAVVRAYRRGQLSDEQLCVLANHSDPVRKAKVLLARAELRASADDARLSSYDELYAMVHGRRKP